MLKFNYILAINNKISTLAIKFWIKPYFASSKSFIN